VSKLFETDKVHDTKELANNSTEFLKPGQKEFVLRTAKSKRLFILIISHAFAATLILNSPKNFITAFSYFPFDTIFF